jgi:hypothetical protein
MSFWSRIKSLFWHRSWEPGLFELHVENRVKEIAARAGHNLDEPPSEQTARLLNIKRIDSGR